MGVLQYAPTERRNLSYAPYPIPPLSKNKLELTGKNSPPLAFNRLDALFFFQFSSFASLQIPSLEGMESVCQTDARLDDWIRYTP